MSRKKTGIHALYSKNPGHADWVVWGRKVDPLTRRGFLQGSGYVAMTAALGATIPFASLMPGGLIIDDNWLLVNANCSACHSAKLVTQNRGNRQTWLEIIRWMQETQGLWQFDPTTEKNILDYVAKNYPPSAVARRAPLPRTMLPANPYTVAVEQ